MILLLAQALGHPSGGHRIDHTMEWTITPRGSELLVVMDLPHNLLEDQPDAELLSQDIARKWILAVDDKTVPFAVQATRVRELPHGARWTLQLESIHGPGRLQLSNGNQLDADGLHHRRIRLSRDLDPHTALDTFPATSPRARRTVLEVRPASWNERLHRAWVREPLITDLPRPLPHWAGHRTTPWTAAILATGSLATACIARRTPLDVGVAFLLGALPLFLPGLPPWAWLLTAAGLLLLLPRSSAVALAASTDLYGLGMLVAVLSTLSPGQSWPRGCPPPRAAKVVGGAVLLLQAARLLA